MIRIGRASFEFVAADEAFAHTLYAEWEHFCRTCFENVTERCLATYGKNNVLYEIETLDLDLGPVPEEEFYREFPRRLREELLKALPSLRLSAREIREERTEAARLENLLFYLKHGCPQAEWADEDFDPTGELVWATAQRGGYTEKIIRLCADRESVLRRLLWQTDDDAALLRLYAAALSEQTSGLREKRRFLILLLEAKPRIPVRFVHEAAGDTDLHGMAELLDTLSVCRIMTTEAQEHAEVDLPPYWHYLYEWLIRYYPFNGLAIFGSKGDFTRHLHYKLLTFVRKRNHSRYLSKAELTAGFLLEVFGHAHYIEVWNAIYNLQPHHPDGSPVPDGYLDRELYRIFRSLSWLRQSDRPPKIVQKLPRDWIRLLRKQPVEHQAVSLLATRMPASLLLQNMAQADFRQTALLSQTVEWLQRRAGSFPFLTGGNVAFSSLVSQALLLYLQDKDTLGGRALTEKETLHKFLSYLHFASTGKPDYRDHADWAELSVKMALDVEPDTSQEVQELIDNNTTLPVEKLWDTDLPENIRKIVIHRHIHLHPKELLDTIRRSVEQKALPLGTWLGRLDTGDWLRLADSLSLSRAELLRQVAEHLPESCRAGDAGLRTAWAACLVRNRAEGLVYNSREEVIRSFVESIPALQEKTEAEREEVARKMTEAVRTTPEEERLPVAEQKTSAGYLLTGHAGLCLAAPWFPRLFDRLGYLSEDKRDFKDTASQIRAAFLLQYLACPEEKRFRETELSFHRLLAALPIYIPLPERLPLTDEERQTAEGMLAGIKANWKQMDGTSTAGFRQSFLARPGSLEEQDEKWVLTVNERAFDVLLDTLPWSFRQIRFPWLKKYVQVCWREQQALSF